MVSETSVLLFGDLKGLPLRPRTGLWANRSLDEGGVFAGVFPRPPGDLGGVLLGLSKTLEPVDSRPLCWFGD